MLGVDQTDFRNDTYCASHFLEHLHVERMSYKLEGLIMVENFLPGMMQLIVKAKSRQISPGDETIDFLGRVEKLETIEAETQQEERVGEYYFQSEEYSGSLYSAAGRYADILMAVHHCIRSYYPLYLSQIRHNDYDPELQGEGLEEYDIYHTLTSTYEEQLKKLTSVYISSKNVLSHLILHGLKEKDIEIVDKLVECFTWTVLHEYKSEAQWSYDQFFQIVKDCGFFRQYA